MKFPNAQREKASVDAQELWIPQPQNRGQVDQAWRETQMSVMAAVAFEVKFPVYPGVPHGRTCSRASSLKWLVFSWRLVSTVASRRQIVYQFWAKPERPSIKRHLLRLGGGRVVCVVWFVSVLPMESLSWSSSLVRLSMEWKLEFTFMCLRQASCRKATPDPLWQS